MPRVPTPRYAHPDAAGAGGPDVAEDGDAGPARGGLARLLAGVGLAVLMLILGLLAKTGPLARADLRVDEHIAAHDRTGALTSLFRAVTDLATPETVGVGLMIVIPVILVLARRRPDAAKVFCMFAGAFTLAELGKKLINEHRPPSALWAMKADSGASYPSGHVTVAAVLPAALIVIAATWAGRTVALVLGGLYTVAVAVSRVYLADHYPADVLGSVVCALAAALIVTGLAALPAVQPWLRRLDARGRR
jgi:membrane-associated phospholipid phosphatase